MFSFLTKKSATPAYVPMTVHAEVAAERAADLPNLAAVKALAVEHKGCSDDCSSFVAAEIERREAWGWK